jgi:hypothetical protein
MSIQSVFNVFSFTNYRKQIDAVTNVVHTYVLTMPTYVPMDESVLKLICLR